MSDAVIAHPDLEKHPNDNQTYSIDFTDTLGSRTISEVDSISAESGLSVSAAQVNASTYVDDNTGDTVAVGKAVLFSSSGGTAGTNYKITATVTLSDGSTLAGSINMRVRA